MLPGGDGIELGRRIRQVPALRMTPVIFVTAKSSETDRLTGFDVGADDYISKPFNPKELVARVKAVLRRFERPLVPTVLKFDEVEVNTGAMTLFVAGKQVPTTATEFRLLEFLVRNAGKVHRRDQILDAVWRDTDFVTQRSVDVYVRKLREKIERDPENPRRLLTVRGAGYRFEADR
jgi:two-component system phosphate regulon response regulator PhoB